MKRPKLLLIKTIPLTFSKQLLLLFFNQFWTVICLTPPNKPYKIQQFFFFIFLLNWRQEVHLLQRNLITLNWCQTFFLCVFAKRSRKWKYNIYSSFLFCLNSSVLSDYFWKLNHICFLSSIESIGFYCILMKLTGWYFFSVHCCANWICCFGHSRLNCWLFWCRFLFFLLSFPIVLFVWMWRVMLTSE